MPRPTILRQKHITPIRFQNLMMDEQRSEPIDWPSMIFIRKNMMGNKMICIKLPKQLPGNWNFRIHGQYVPSIQEDQTFYMDITHCSPQFLLTVYFNGAYQCALHMRIHCVPSHCISSHSS